MSESGSIRHVRTLNFHGIGAPPAGVPAEERPYWIDAELLGKFLDEVVRRPDLRVTFDDGNRSDADIAAPALIERGLEATFFAVASRLSDERYLSAKDLRYLLSLGMRVGSHGMDHRSWRRQPPEILSREIDDAKRALEDACGCAVTEAACPFGEYDRRSLAALRRAGFLKVYTGDRTPARPEAWFQPRYTFRAGQTPALVLDDGRPSVLRRGARWWGRLKQAAKRLR
ncbi:MAG: polysaccharide deacetylase family protein [Planctomycetes bacterium]|nr:polysaccharide deacetylase family protein [Planctomycetota bacterium]